MIRNPFLSGDPTLEEYNSFIQNVYLIFHCCQETFNETP